MVVTVKKGGKVYSGKDTTEAIAKSRATKKAPEKKKSVSQPTSQLSQKELTNLSTTGKSGERSTPVADLPQMHVSTPLEQAQTSPGGQAISNLITGFTNQPDPEGRSLTGQPDLMTFGRLVSFATTLGAVSSLASGAQAITNALAQEAKNKSALKALEAIRLNKAYKVIRGKNALNLAKRIGTGSKVANIGINVGGTTAVVASNPVTKTLLSKVLIGAGFSLSAVYLIKEAYDSFVFGDFQVNEGMDKIGYARSDAREEGRQDLVDDLNALEDDILNPIGWDKVMSELPWLTAQAGTADNLEAAKAASEVYKQIDEDRRIQIENGETETDKWIRIKQQEQDQYETNAANYDEKAKQLFLWKQEAANADMVEDAAFWAKEHAKQKKLEEEDRKAIADFWLAYRKKSLEISDNNRPSKLNFGLV
ncbi:MAG: hypothetical protein DRP42_03850 [Tenericutes bacterium]|nr:MAG: hypothetical protein DRP42_03850 [Mycoplasmatota bacterium]